MLNFNLVLILIINFSFAVNASIQEQITITRSFLISSNTDYNLTSRIYSDSNEIINYRILIEDNEIYVGTAALSASTFNQISISFSTENVNSSIGIIEFQIGNFYRIGFDWIDLEVIGNTSIQVFRDDFTSIIIRGC